MRHPFVRLDSFVVAISLAVAAFLGCSGTTTRGGSESNFQHCSTDTDCSVGVCMGGLCKTQGTGGGAGLLDAGSGEGGAAGRGVAGNHPTFPDAGRLTPLVDAGAGGFAAGGFVGAGGTDAGCSAGGLMIDIGVAGSGTGGAMPDPPTCPVDANGYASADDATMCGLYRCPTKASDLLLGSTCVQSDGITTGNVTLLRGCGYQWVTIAATDTTYTAAFDGSGQTLIAIEAKGPYPSGPCNAFGYRKGTMPPACNSGTFYQCDHDSGTKAGPYGGCRDPRDPGCSICCTPTNAGDTCAMTTADPQSLPVYNTGTSLPSACPCNCPSCATCSKETENELRFMPEHPECQCPVPPPSGSGGAQGTGGTGSGGADPCDSYCPYRNQLITQCPGVVPG